MSENILYKRRLPHLRIKGGVYFITFRLNFLVPKKYIAAYNRYKIHLNAEIKEKNDKIKQDIISKKLFAFIDDRYGEYVHEISITENADVATIIQDKILEMGETHYYLYTFTLMPNHVHILIKPNITNDVSVKLSDIMMMMKGSTSRRANLLLGRKGKFWAKEYYDRVVRTQEELFNIFEYIRLNPVKAKLVEDADDWKWTWINPEYLM